MSELRLVGLDDDEAAVVLQGPDGQRFTLPIDDALRAAVRRDRPLLEQVRARATSAVPPREMQARMRAGASAQEVAEDAGVPVEVVERYEGPVLAERAWVAEQARGTRIGHETSAPTLGDLVTDRLATRGVGPGATDWDASRDASGPWCVAVRFEVGGVRRSARWAFDAGARTLRALDDEARWLSETDLAEGPVPRRHLAAVRTTELDVSAALRPVLAAVDLPPAASEPVEEPSDPAAATEALLEDLRDRRGTRQALEPEADDDLDEFEGFGPQHAFDFDRPGLTAPPGAHPAESRPDEAVDATVLPLTGRTRAAQDEPEPAEALAPALPDETTTPRELVPARAASASPDPDAEPPAGHAPEPVDAEEHPATGAAAGSSGRGRSRKGRASVPSWDEIVFGAKPE
jgi:hypothetical protein